MKDIIVKYLTIFVFLVHDARSVCGPGSELAPNGCPLDEYTLYRDCVVGRGCLIDPTLNNWCNNCTIPCAPFNLKHTQYKSDEHTDIVIKLKGATSITVEFTYSSLEWDTDTVSVIDSCPYGFYNLYNCHIIGTQSGWEQNHPELHTYTSNTGFMVLRWFSSPSTNYVGFKARITAEPNFPGCVPCPIGTYKPYDGNVPCTPCPADTYASSIGNVWCSACEIGKYNHSTGSANCSDCPKGSYGVIGSYNGADTYGAYCTGCPPGTFSYGTGLTSSFRCFQCAAGRYNIEYGLTTCIGCDRGTYNGYEGLTSCEGKCNAGKYGLYSYAASNTSCFQCQVGSFAANQGQSICDKCPTGKYTSSTGQSACEKCPTGTYSNITGLTVCQRCPGGTYNSMTGTNSSSYCLQCSIGTYAMYSGAAVCDPCPPGRYSNITGVTTCAKCPPGTYNNGQGMISISNCTPCAIGTYQAAYESISCLPCPPGLYGVTIGLSQCQVCQDGYYLASSVSECPSELAIEASNVYTLQKKYTVTCAKGAVYRDKYGDSEYSEVIIAPPGAVSISITFTSMCTESAEIEDVKFYECTSIETCTQTCELISRNDYYCDYSYIRIFSGCYTKTAFDFPAPFRSNTGILKMIWRTDPERPTLTGFRFTFEATIPGSLKCSQCPAGTFSSGQNNTACTLCPTGTYYGGAGAQLCPQCPAGTFGPSTGAVNTSTCYPCKTGEYSEKGSSNCTICPPGTYNNETGAPYCTPCQAGTYGTLKGALNNSACITCPDGKYSSKGGSTECWNCQICPWAGYYKLGCGANSSGICTTCSNTIY